MNKRFASRIVLVVILAITALLSVPFAGAQDGDEVPRTGIRPDAPPYGVRGPYAVGVAEHVIDDGHERPLDAFIWYPALNPDGAEEMIAYTLPYWRGMTITGQALQDAAPDFEHGPYPLVIFVHGLNSHRVQSVFLCEHLASHGFVVVAVDYQDNAGVLQQPSYPSIISRPDDVTRQIDYAEQLTSAGDWTGLIDVERVGVTGHSFGGYTTLAAAGARLEFDSGWCEIDPALDPLGACRGLLGQQEDIAAVAGLDAVPDGPWPSYGDPRVDAVAPLAPLAGIFGPEGVAEITVPVMLLGGTQDTILYPETHFYAPYAALTAPKTLVRFAHADHVIFALDCDAVPWMIEWGLYEFCSDRVWDMDRAHDLIDHFVAAFFLAELYGDTDAAAALAPEAVQFPGITYETTEF